MAKLGINTGTSPDAGDGDALLTGAIKINSNFDEIYNLLGDGTNLAPGIVTSIVAGTNVTVSGSTGQVTINAISGGGTSSQWVTTAAGIHTLSNVGIGTTNPTSTLTVQGTLSVSGVSTFTIDPSVGVDFVNESSGYNIRISSDGGDSSTRIRFEDGSGNGTSFQGISGGNLQVFSDGEFSIWSASEQLASFSNGSASLLNNTNTKLQTLGTGVTVTGTTFTDQLSVSSVSTFIGSVGIGTINPGEKLQVDGNIRVGISTTSNYIAFRGTTLDGPFNIGGELPYEHTFIGERIYEENSEKSELLLFKGNDIDDGGSGPDRIRLFAGEHRFDVLGFSTSGTFEQVGVSTAAINAVIINTTGVGIGTTNPTVKLEVNGSARVGINTSTGLILTSPNGTQYQLFVENDGTLKTVAV